MFSHVHRKRGSPGDLWPSASANLCFGCVVGLRVRFFVALVAPPDCSFFSLGAFFCLPDVVGVHVR